MDGEKLAPAWRALSMGRYSLRQAQQLQALAHRGSDAGFVEAALGEHLRWLGVFDVGIRQAQVQELLENAFLGQELADGTAGAAHDGVFLDGHQQLVAAGDLAHQGSVQGFDETHVDHGGVELLGHLQRFGQLHAEYQQRHLLALATDHALADLDRLQVLVDRCVGAGATWIAHRCRAVVQVAGGEHLAQFVLVAGVITTMPGMQRR